LTKIDGLPGEIVGLSADGSVVVGVSADMTQTFRWKLGQGVITLTIPGSTRVEAPDDRQSISADGAFVTGEVTLPSATIQDQIFRWDVDAGTFTLLPSGVPTEVVRVTGSTDPGTYLLTPRVRPSISADGNTIVWS